MNSTQIRSLSSTNNTINKLSQLYNLNVQNTPVKSMNQFDNFTLVRFFDDSYYVAFAPTSITSITSIYGRSVTGSTADNYLKIKSALVLADFTFRA